MIEDAGSALRFVVAIAAAFLPRALWSRLEDSGFPVYLAAAPSAAMAFFTGFALGVPSFLIYAWRVANENTDVMLAAAARQQQTHVGTPVTGAMSVAPGIFTPVAFVFFTPVGLASLYLVVGGFVRLIAAMVDEPFGDPLLTGFHHATLRLRHRRASSLAASRRASLEGTEVPDRYLPGPAAGMPSAAIVVLSARRKPGWEEGVLVVTERGWFRIGRIFEEYHDGGLRTLYPLFPSPQTEVMRRAVTYDLPALEEDGDADPPASV